MSKVNRRKLGLPGTETIMQPDVSRHANEDEDGLLRRGRSIFAAGLVHELRTPLTILKGRLLGLEDGVIDPSSGECDRLLRQIDQLLRIVDDLGTLARAYAGELMFDLRSADLDQIIARAVAEVRSTAMDARVDMSVTCASVMVRCDPVRLTRAFTILFQFVISRVGAGHSLEIGGNSDGTLILTSQSGGLKWETSQEKLLFVPFYRGPESGDAASESRIGPALAAALIQAHGGSITTRRQPERDAHPEIVIMIPVGNAVS